MSSRWIKDPSKTMAFVFLNVCSEQPNGLSHPSIHWSQSQQPSGVCSSTAGAVHLFITGPPVETSQHPRSHSHHHTNRVERPVKPIVNHPGNETFFLRRLSQRWLVSVTVWSPVSIGEETITSCQWLCPCLQMGRGFHGFVLLRGHLFVLFT